MGGQKAAADRARVLAVGSTVSRKLHARCLAACAGHDGFSVLSAEQRRPQPPRSHFVLPTFQATADALVVLKIVRRAASLDSLVGGGADPGDAQLATGDVYYSCDVDEAEREEDDDDSVGSDSSGSDEEGEEEEEEEEDADGAAADGDGEEEESAEGDEEEGEESADGSDEGDEEEDEDEAEEEEEEEESSSEDDDDDDDDDDDSDAESPKKKATSRRAARKATSSTAAPKKPAGKPAPKRGGVRKGGNLATVAEGAVFGGAHKAYLAPVRAALTDLVRELVAQRPDAPLVALERGLRRRLERRDAAKARRQPRPAQAAKTPPAA